MKNLITYVLLFFSLQLNAQGYNLPALKYTYESYEPFIDAQTMEIHHSKHHQAYVKNLNKAIAGINLEKITLNTLMLNVSQRADVIRNNAGGHFNHSLFWEILAPKEKQTTNITNEFDSEVKTTFGHLDSIKAKLNQAASTRFGSGWAWLIVTPDKKLVITSTPNQDNPIMDVAKDRGIPILGIDVWEHAYYLKYQNKRGDYLSAIWNLIDWGIVSEKYNAALTDPLLNEIEKDSWPELKDFHKTLSESFHPTEKGDFSPLKKNCGTLLAKAVLLRNSVLPNSLKNKEIDNTLKIIEEKCEELYELKSKKIKDEILKKKIIEIHDQFHLVMKKCFE
jgi:superoxide dismutase